MWNEDTAANLKGCARGAESRKRRKHGITTNVALLREGAWCRPVGHRKETNLYIDGLGQWQRIQTHKRRDKCGLGCSRQIPRREGEGVRHAKSGAALASRTDPHDVQRKDPSLPPSLIYARSAGIHQLVGRHCPLFPLGCKLYRPVLRDSSHPSTVKTGHPVEKFCMLSSRLDYKDGSHEVTSETFGIRVFIRISMKGWGNIT